MGKTETIKKRTIPIYLPSLEEKKKWYAKAREAQIPVSRWIRSVVQEYLETNQAQVRQQLEEGRRENQELSTKLSKAEKRVDELEIIRDKLEEELRKYRAKPFTAAVYRGTRRYNKKLVRILRDQDRALSSDEILDGLGVGPSEDEAIAGISKQLENLEGYGLVKSEPSGWRWAR